MKKRLIYWINLVFLMINTAFLIFSFSYHNTNPAALDEGQNLSVDFVRRELDFTKEQVEELNQLDRNLQENYQKVMQMLCQNRYKLLNELAKPNPSRRELSRISQTIGRLHWGLKNQTVRHLLNVKKVCTPEQTQKLNKIFIEILEINKSCVRCKKKCTQQEKCKRYPQFIYSADSVSILPAGKME